MEQLEILHATDRDFPRILDLVRRSLGWSDDDARYLRWKHSENPFGSSPMWIAVARRRVVGFRAFLRWEFVSSDGGVVRAVRAVDTATDPDFQGQGVFTRLTRTAIDELATDGVEFIFNTPNAQSLPGYLKMGWRRLGRLPASVRPARLRFPVVVLTARHGAARWSVPTMAGEDAGAALADPAPIERLLALVPRPSGLSTRRTAALLQWRYGFAPLGYRAMLAGTSPEAGLALFRLRRRGRAVEAVLCEVLVPGGDVGVARTLVHQIARRAEPDYLIRLGPGSMRRDRFARLPGLGPVFACRPLDGSSPAPLEDWALTMGDIELL